jgi:hypothetical protein
MTENRPVRKKKVRKRHEPAIAGWRESVTLPDLGIGPLVAKLDTGARSAALHAANINIYETDDGQRVRFDAFIDNTRAHARSCDLPVHATRNVKNTGGGVEQRIVVTSMIELGNEKWQTEITLTDRSDMGVPMLLGRKTIKRRFLVHPSRTYLLTSLPGKRT